MAVAETEHEDNCPMIKLKTLNISDFADFPNICFYCRKRLLWTLRPNLETMTHYQRKIQKLTELKIGSLLLLKNFLFLTVKGAMKISSDWTKKIVSQYSFSWNQLLKWLPIYKGRFPLCGTWKWKAESQSVSPVADFNTLKLVSCIFIMTWYKISYSGFRKVFMNRDFRRSVFDELYIHTYDSKKSQKIL